MAKLRVGLIGASPGRSWATRAHLPALAALDDVELVAVATTRQESADATARQHGVPRAYGSAAALIADPDVDAVSVVVRVPGHRELVEQAVAAGKPVFCEWPLARNLAEATALRDQARVAGVLTMVGLQGRRSPVVRYVRDLVRDGFVGRVLSCDVAFSTAELGSARIPLGSAWSVDRAAGRSIFTIGTGHSLDALAFCLDSRLAELTSIVRTQTDRATVEETGEELAVTAPDQTVIAGILANGATVALHSQGGAPKSAGFRFAIHGDRGTLEMAGPEGVQTSELVLRGATGPGAMAAMQAPTEYEDDLSTKVHARVANVARAYRAFAAAVRDAAPVHPDFDDAVRLHELLDSVERASATGQRQHLPE